MKNVLCLFLAAALLLGCGALAEDAPGMEKDLVVLFTSDVHCGVDQGWGYAGLYAVKQSLSKDHYVLLVDNGDAIQGEPIDPNKVYKIASLDYYLLDKGDGFAMFDGCTVVQESVKVDYQALSDYITGTLGGVVGEGYENPYGQGRIVSVNAE